MSYLQFVDQIQDLMSIQYMKCNQKTNKNEIKYDWLRKKASRVNYIPIKKELLIQQALRKLTDKQKMEIIKQLIHYLERNPSTEVNSIPDTALLLLEKADMCNIIRKVSVRNRRSILKSFMIPNKVTPILSLKNFHEIRRRVGFDNQPVYCITK